MTNPETGTMTRPARPCCQRMGFSLDPLMDSRPRILVCSRRHRLWVVPFLEFLPIVHVARRLSGRHGKPLDPPVYSLPFRPVSEADRFPWRLADWRSDANDTNLR